MLPGDSLIGKIESGLTESDFLLVVLSPHSVNSPWCQKELRSALTFEINGKPLKVIGALIWHCDIPPFLSEKLYVDFRSSYAEALRRLLSAFIVRPDISDLPAPLLEKWAQKNEARYQTDSFEAFVHQEFSRQHELFERQELLAKASAEYVALLLDSSPDNIATPDMRLALLAAAYGYVLQCRYCAKVMLDLHGLCNALQGAHSLALPASELYGRLVKHTSLFASGSGSGLCFACSIP